MECRDILCMSTTSWGWWENLGKGMQGVDWLFCFSNNIWSSKRTMTFQLRKRWFVLQRVIALTISYSNDLKVPCLTKRCSASV